MADTETQQNADDKILALVERKVDEAIEQVLEELWSRPTHTGPDYLITSPEMMRIWALEVIKIKWGMRNPPPWLICVHTGESYKLGRY